MNAASHPPPPPRRPPPLLQPAEPIATSEPPSWSSAVTDPDGVELGEPVQAQAKGVVAPSCAIVLHYHVGGTGGTAIRAWFHNSSLWNVTINPSGLWTLFAGHQYIEIHCGSMTLAQTVERLEQIQLGNSKRCTVSSFIVIRDPHDALCSAQAHHNNGDYEAYS